MAKPEYHDAIREALGHPKELPVSFVIPPPLLD